MGKHRHQPAHTCTSCTQQEDADAAPAPAVESQAQQQGAQPSSAQGGASQARDGGEEELPLILFDLNGVLVTERPTTERTFPRATWTVRPNISLLLLLLPRYVRTAGSFTASHTQQSSNSALNHMYSCAPRFTDQRMHSCAHAPCIQYSHILLCRYRLGVFSSAKAHNVENGLRTVVNEANRGRKALDLGVLAEGAALDDAASLLRACKSKKARRGEQMVQTWAQT